jgi:hypothetical protein
MLGDVKMSVTLSVVAPSNIWFYPMLAGSSGLKTSLKTYVTNALAYFYGAPTLSMTIIIVTLPFMLGVMLNVTIMSVAARFSHTASDKERKKFDTGPS